MITLNSKLSQIALAFIAVFAFTACGSGCKSGDAKDSLTETIKESLSKKYPQFAEQISKIKVSFEKITTTNESKDGKSASCAVEQIHLKYDTGDTIFYDNDKSRFAYSVRKGDKGISVSTNIGSKIDDMQKDLLAYYTGLGVLINGTRKGGCNGTYQEKDKNGDIAVEGNCVGGLRDGVWKWFDNGLFLKKEIPYKSGLKNGVAKEYYSKEGTIRMTKDYTDDKLNGAVRSYRGGILMFFLSYKNGVVDGKMLIPTPPRNPIEMFSKLASGFVSLSEIAGSLNGQEIIEIGQEAKLNWVINKLPHNRRFNYIEIVNGTFVLGRDFKGMPNGKNEQEILSQWEERGDKPIEETIIINQLELRYDEYDRSIISSFYKNGEKVGSVEMNRNYTSGLCQQRGKCEEVFKELIEKSFYKNQIYARLSGKEYVEPTNSTQNSAQTAQPNEQGSQSVELSETPNTQRTDEAKASEQEIHNTNENSSEVPNVTQANEQIKPSFDCAKASTKAEKLVCSDNELANLDNELSKAYANARNLLDNAGKKQLTSEQKAWLETYNQCADKECVKQSLQKRIELLKSTDMQIYLATKDEFVNLRKSPNGEIITPIYKKDFDKIILKRLGVEDKWLKVLYFPPNVSDEKEALTGYIHNSQVR